MENVMTQLISKTMPVSGGIIHTLSIIVSWGKLFMSPLMSGTDLHGHREFEDTPLIRQNHQECSRAGVHTGVIRTRQKQHKGYCTQTCQSKNTSRNSQEELPDSSSFSQ